MTILNYSLVISLIFYTLIGKNINALYLKNAQIDKSNFKIYRSRYLVLSVLFIAIIATLSFTKGLIVKNVFENNIEMLYKTLDQNLILSLIIVIAGYLDLVNQKAVRKSKSKYRPINVLYLVTLLALYLIIAPLVL